MASFPWIPIYRELAKKLISYRDRQSELLEILADARAQGRKVIILDDENERGEKIPLEVIDPFTFFASFNRSGNYDDRSRTLEHVKQRMDLKADVPKTFDGIPIANPLHSWFFAYEPKRQPDDLEVLWDIATQAANAESAGDLDPQLFDKALNILGVGKAKLSMGLFWLNPHQFVPMDKNMRAYFQDRGVPARVRNGREYIDLVRRVREKLGDDFPNISDDAYHFHREETTVKKRQESIRDQIDLELLDRAVDWTIRPLLLDQGQLREGGNEGYQHHEIIPSAADALKPENIEQNPRRALSEALAADVNLLNFLEADKAKTLAQVAEANELRDHLLNLLYDRGDLENRLQSFLDWAQPRKTNDGKTATINATVASYLLAVSSPAEYAFCKPETYTRAASALMGREHVIGQSDSAGRVVHATAFYKIVLELFQDRYELPFSDLMHVHITFYLLQAGVAEHPTWDELLTRSYPEREEDLGTTSETSNEPSSPYTVDHAMPDLFVERETFERWLEVIRRKKNVILQGPPGVGKTFVAKRLAYALMGERDDRRVELVQFHQAYTYEDFIQGFRPSEGGNFRLKNGTFYLFCQRAQLDPDRDYVFIIDEINRGNLSKILGELMMLIEADKRGSEWSMPLTYSQDSMNGEDYSRKFFVPANVYLIGMMNTADRSLAMVDYALRRRFAFITLTPQFHSTAFSDFLKKRGASASLIDRIAGRMQDLNDTISNDATNLGEGFSIGHSYFCPPDAQTVDRAWFDRVIDLEIAPLIREYWFDKPSTADKLISALKSD